MSVQRPAGEDELRESRARLVGILGGMSQGVIAVDQHQRIFFSNASAGKLLGFVPSAVEGQLLLEVVPDSALADALAKAGRDGPPQLAELKRNGGEPHIIEVSITALACPANPGWVLSLQDVTQLRRLETIRREFVANVSHELKTPLSSIKAYAETLSSGAIHDANYNLRFVQCIEEQAERLNVLINDLISLAQIESGQQVLELQPIDVAPVANASLRGCGKLAENKQLRLLCEPETEHQVLADANALEQILKNLVDNAVQYSRPGGTVRVAWRAVGNEMEIDVCDTGIGIADEHRARLFERFFRVDKGRSRELGGTGLGLSIVKHLVQALHGNVRIESQLGEGSKFTVTLPLA